MAVVPKGPGQEEVTGDLRDPRQPEAVGTYRDPESGAELEVTMGAGADALARMGWKHVAHLGADAPVPPNRSSVGDEDIQARVDAAVQAALAKKDAGKADEAPATPEAPDTVSEPAANELNDTNKDVEKPQPTAAVDDADQVEEQQDNAAGHKAEDIDGEPGVPAGPPEDLQAEEQAAKGDTPKPAK